MTTYDSGNYEIRIHERLGKPKKGYISKSLV